ncbi:unnamed protein product, partial [Tenebrio molitor]
FTRLDDRRTFILLGNTLKFRYQFQYVSREIFCEYIVVFTRDLTTFKMFV